MDVSDIYRLLCSQHTDYIFEENKKSINVYVAQYFR